MRRLLPIVLACLLTPALAMPAAAAGSFNQTAPFAFGAYRNGTTWATPADCLAGYAGAIEYRCAWEFSLQGIPSGQLITSAKLRVTRTANCPDDNCPVLLNWYTGNGNPDVADVTAGSGVAFSWTPSNNSSHTFNVLDQITDAYAAGHDWQGFNLRASSNYGQFQYFDPQSISLEVTYGKSVTILVEPFFNGGTGKVTSDPSRINCPDICGRDFADGTSVTLTAKPDAGSAFSEWRTGPCAHSTKLTCSFDVPTSDVTIAVTFVAKPSPTPTPSPTPKATPRPTATPHPTATPPTGGSAAPSAAPTAPAPPSTAAGSVEPSAAQASPPPSSAASAAASSEVTATPSATEAGSIATAGATAAPGPVAQGSGDGGVPLWLVLLLLIMAIVIGGGGFLLGARRRKPSA